MEPKAPSPSERIPRQERRKPYQKPQIHEYGDLATITQGKAGTKGSDGAGHPNKHFTS